MDGNLGKEDMSENVPNVCTHREVMRSLGYDIPEPVVKKNKSVWGLLVDEFPCPPQLQHAIWAARILRNMNKECGYPGIDWTCECEKCSYGLAMEINNNHMNMCEMKLDDKDTSAVQSYSPVCTKMLRAICSGVEELSMDSQRLAPTQGVNPSGAPYPFMHLFLSEAESGTRSGPQTPFITAVFTGEEDEDMPMPPRVMWVRAKSIVPTHLSFKRVV